MKKLLVLLLAAVLVFSMAACGTANTPTGGGNTQTPAQTSTPSTPTVEGTPKVGISMPTMSLQRWNQDGNNMKAMFESAGYEADLQYGGDNDVPTQVAQLENMIANDVDVLVIAAIEGDSLSTVLEGAKAKNIAVIAYDRLIMNSDAVSYYATFDNFKVGVLQGSYIEEALGLKTNAGPFNIELFTGDPGDNNIRFFFPGAMSVLQPYIDSGKLVVPSGVVDIMAVATEGWSTEKAQSRMENLISSQGYGPNGKKLDAVMSSNDSIANGITNALVNAGYTKDNFPALTGQDCDITSTKNMIAGLQGMSVFKDTRTLAARVVEMATSIINGQQPEVNDTSTYNNNVKVVPSYLCEPVFGTAANYKELLIDSGYYTEDQLQ